MYLEIKYKYKETVYLIKVEKFKMKKFILILLKS